MIVQINSHHSYIQQHIGKIAYERQVKTLIASNEPSIATIF